LFTASPDLAGLGATAIVFAILVPRGVSGAVTDRFGIQLLPVGRELVVSEEPAQEPDP
jgi:branched-chain amino acid transport system permease protein